MPAARDASARPRSTSSAPMSATGTGPRRNRARATGDGRQDRGRVVGTQHDAGFADRLLERLEQRVLGIRVEPVGGLDDGHADATLHGQQRQVRDERLDLADPDLVAGSFGREPMQVGVVAVLHLATRGADATGPRRAGPVRMHRSPAARSIASVVLPTARGPTSRIACGARPRVMARRTAASASG